MRKLLVICLIFAVSFSACFFYKKEKGLKNPAIGEQDYLIQYLGAEGFVIRHGDMFLLTAPLFSNPIGPVVAAGEIKADKRAIKKFGSHLKETDIILVGHAHYDHLMDIPYLCQKIAKKAKIYGSLTAQNILLAELPKRRLFAVNDPADNKMATSTEPGEWIYYTEDTGPALRFLPIKSYHAPHIGNDTLNFTFYQGHVPEPLKKLPPFAAEWKEGQTLSYLIDFLDPKQNITFRIYFQDAVSTSPLGLPPEEILEEHKVNVAVLCVPTFDKVSDYPEYIVKALKPETIFLGHWEDFMLPYSLKEEETFPFPLSFPEIFIERLEKVLPPGSKWIMPLRGGNFVFQEDRSDDQL